MSSVGKLQQAHELSREILAAASEHDWDAVAELESRWSLFVVHCFEKPPAIDIEQALEIQQLNSGIIACLAQHRQRVSDERSHLNRGNKASRAYLATTSYR